MPGGDTEFIVVTHQLDFGGGKPPGEMPDYLRIGFDVDQTCTNRGDPPRCTPGDWTEGDPTDGLHGEDQRCRQDSVVPRTGLWPGNRQQ